MDNNIDEEDLTSFDECTSMTEPRYIMIVMVPTPDYTCDV